ncbi:hypothetical protein Poli38472_010485 [Pythium oligandrum]|uniref:Potassium channel tetramerisation-type BTB domain-containing protein n=1 Tax=Pythium oligandrum TaxID=41045 RepID=A0A8K1FE80_PYTOL|nr:hypothetical protein Poli38472_010485 [Pythium oligandrum]|eukprot:TMW55603.1 hypothetical protein Poli38472_010485 [Pythium oligandrum]
MHMTALMTERIDTAALESLFTERRREEGEEDEEDQPVTDEEDDGDEPDGQVVNPQSPVESVESTTGNTTEETEEDNEPEGALLKPEVPPRPARPPLSPSLMLSTTHATSHHTSTATSPSNGSVHVIAFDVGGRLFRCKASLIRKFPSKRLNQVVNCGCEQICNGTFFIDRNPLHFEIILDWYRTGKYIKHPNVNEEAFKEDARYFDLYDEFFPSTPAVVTHTSVRITRQRSVKPPSSASAPWTPRAGKAPSLSTTVEPMIQFSKREFRELSPIGRPAVFAVRAHEHLVVESVRGSGRLFVRVCDFSGMHKVFVDQAVLFDSRSWFYLQDDGRAKLQQCVLPGNHMYTFWVEPHNASSPTKSAAAANPEPTPPFEVEFRLIYSFNKDDRLAECDAEELGVILRAKGNGWSNGSTVAAPLSPPGMPISDAKLPPCLFLPPRTHQDLPTTIPAPRSDGMEQLDASCFAERDAIAEQMLAQSTTKQLQRKRSHPTLANKGNELTSPPTSGNINAVVIPLSPQKGLSAVPPAVATVIKRNGAAIVHGMGKGSPTDRAHGGEKVTVHHQDKSLLLASSPRADH